MCCPRRRPAEVRQEALGSTKRCLEIFSKNPGDIVFAAGRSLEFPECETFLSAFCYFSDEKSCKRHLAKIL